MDAALKAEIVERLCSMVADMAPDANLRPMYGGTVIELETDNPKSRVGGIFAYEAHVSLELAQGAMFDDPQGVLEGKGKFRRHVKLTAVADIEGKDCVGFLRRAMA